MCHKLVQAAVGRLHLAATEAGEDAPPANQHVPLARTRSASDVRGWARRGVTRVHIPSSCIFLVVFLCN